MISVAFDEPGAQNNSCLEQFEIRCVIKVDQPDIRRVLVNFHRTCSAELLIRTDRAFDLDCIHRGDRGCVHHEPLHWPLGNSDSLSHEPSGPRTVTWTVVDGTIHHQVHGE